jgi:4-amino-4-deoxy-L-arabinose transferase-like glycosyltransferase
MMHLMMEVVDMLAVRLRTLGHKLIGSPGSWPVIVFSLSVLPRLVFLLIAKHPGLWDPTEYYSLAVNLHRGRGFTLDYIWNFANHPASVTHPLDHWLPLTGVVAAGSMTLFGASVRAALLPFVLLGGLQSVMVYAFAGRIGASRITRVFAALATAYTPWLFLSSLHTDTTTLFGVLGFGCMAAVYLGTAGSGRWFWVAGVLAGLAALTRNDGVMLIPAGMIGGGWLIWRSKRRVYSRDIVIAGILFGLVLLPWVLRNLSVLGSPWPGSTVRSMFVTDHEDFYAYSKEISLHTYLAQGMPRLVGKIAFELAASVKLMLILVESVFPVAILGGFWDVYQQRSLPPDDPKKPTLSFYVPALCFIVLTYGAYGILFPYMSQAGSFKKAYLAMVPFLLIFGAQTIERHIHPRRAYPVVIGITLALLLANAVELTRADFKLNNSQQAIYEAVKAKLDSFKPTEQREIIVMTRDPWSVNLVTGYRAVMVPNESLDVILQVADRYGATYLLAPVPRTAITAIDEGRAANPRLVRAADLPEYNLHLYRIAPPDQGE